MLDHTDSWTVCVHFSIVPTSTRSPHMDHSAYSSMCSAMCCALPCAPASADRPLNRPLSRSLEGLSACIRYEREREQEQERARARSRERKSTRGYRTPCAPLLL